LWYKVYGKIIIWDFGGSFMNEKRCPQCDEIKPLTEFYKNTSRKDGLSVYCKQCVKENCNDYYLRNKEQCKDRLNRWRADNREYVRARDQKYRQDNPDIEFRKQKRYRERHKEQLYLKGKKYREEHKDYFNNKNRERKLTLLDVSDGTVTLEAEKILYEQQNGLCDYCGCSLEDSGKHLDHIVPISRGGLHTITNVHWTCPTCNMSKGDRLEEEWLDEYL
jgi:5-methylcytosine-specific restriction endonuclease McrA